MARGRDKLRRWLAFTDRSGTFYEYNCPGYTGMSIERLAELAALSNDDETRTIARVFAVRAGLSALLHGHPGTGRSVAPISRRSRPRRHPRSTGCAIGLHRAFCPNGLPRP